MPERVYGGLLKGSWRDLVFEPFREGIAVHWLVKGGASEPSAALLRYDPGASVPSHRHGGLETILVLEGSQSDEKGDYEAGTVVLNAKGNLVGRSPFESKRLLPGERLEFTAEYPDQLPPGEYKAMCSFQFEGKTLTSEGNFEVPKK